VHWTRIVVTPHALDAQAERCAEQRSPAEIKLEIVHAFDAGRTSRRKPSWLHGPKPKESKSATYAWPPGRERVYLLTLNPAYVLHVRTLLVPNPHSPFRSLLKREAAAA